MLITVRCYNIPADITFDTDDVAMELGESVCDNDIILVFKNGCGLITVDRQHYEEQKRQK